WTSRKAAQSNNPSIKSVTLRAGKMAPGSATSRRMMRFACPGYSLREAKQSRRIHAVAGGRLPPLRQNRRALLVGEATCLPFTFFLRGFA
ncbi:MAG: hypothetical protein LBE15_01790, partial [Burkholderiales bacterium]|nr:hypothetical protein [Burkholderiales bacterium]